VTPRSRIINKLQQHLIITINLSRRHTRKRQPGRCNSTIPIHLTAEHQKKSRFRMSHNFAHLLHMCPQDKCTHKQLSHTLSSCTTTSAQLSPSQTPATADQLGVIRITIQTTRQVLVMVQEITMPAELLTCTQLARSSISHHLQLSSRLSLLNGTPGTMDLRVALIR
jgi:hypothetical protein